MAYTEHLRARYDLVFSFNTETLCAPIYVKLYCSLKQLLENYINRVLNITKEMSVCTNVLNIVRIYCLTQCIVCRPTEWGFARCE